MKIVWYPKLWWEPVLIQRMLIGLESTLENNYNNSMTMIFFSNLKRVLNCLPWAIFLLVSYFLALFYVFHGCIWILFVVKHTSAFWMLKKRIYKEYFRAKDIAMEHIDPKLLWLKMHITLHVTSVTLLPIFFDCSGNLSHLSVNSLCNSPTIQILMPDL